MEMICTLWRSSGAGLVAKMARKVFSSYRIGYAALLHMKNMWSEWLQKNHGNDYSKITEMTTPLAVSFSYYTI